MGLTAAEFVKIYRLRFEDSILLSAFFVERGTYFGRTLNENNICCSEFSLSFPAKMNKNDLSLSFFENLPLTIPNFHEALQPPRRMARRPPHASRIRLKKMRPTERTREMAIVSTTSYNAAAING